MICMRAWLDSLSNAAVSSDLRVRVWSVWFFVVGFALVLFRWRSRWRMLAAMMTAISVSWKLQASGLFLARFLSTLHDYWFLGYLTLILGFHDYF